MRSPPASAAVITSLYSSSSSVWSSLPERVTFKTHNYRRGGDFSDTQSRAAAQCSHSAVVMTSTDLQVNGELLTNKQWINSWLRESEEDHWDVKEPLMSCRVEITSLTAPVEGPSAGEDCRDQEKWRARNHQEINRRQMIRVSMMEIMEDVSTALWISIEFVSNISFHIRCLSFDTVWSISLHESTCASLRDVIRAVQTGNTSLVSSDLKMLEANQLHRLNMPLFYLRADFHSPVHTDKTTSRGQAGRWHRYAESWKSFDHSLFQDILTHTNWNRQRFFWLKTCKYVFTL